MYKIGTEEVKMSLFTDDILCLLKNWKNLQLELKNEFSKVSVYKVNIQKLIVFTYMSNKQLKIKFK